MQIYSTVSSRFLPGYHSSIFSSLLDIFRIFLSNQPSMSFFFFRTVSMYFPEKIFRIAPRTFSMSSFENSSKNSTENTVMSTSRKLLQKFQPKFLLESFTGNSSRSYTLQVQEFHLGTHPVFPLRIPTELFVENLHRISSRISPAISSGVSSEIHFGVSSGKGPKKTSSITRKRITRPTPH